MIIKLERISQVGFIHFVSPVVNEKMNDVALKFDPLTDKAAGAVAMRDELQKIAMQLADGTFKVKD